MTGKPPMRYSIFSVQDHYPTCTRTVAELYAQVQSQARLADTLGYDTFFVAEHHFHEYGAVPNPAVMLAALAQQTNRIRLGTAISILTFHHPLTVAENYAMVDALSGGRLVYGVGSGYLKHEFEGYRVTPAEKRDRFNEALEIVRRLLAGERVRHKGQYYQIDDVQLQVPPSQPDGPPTYVAILAKEGAYHVGRQGNRIISVPYASVDHFNEVGDLVASYRKGRQEAGQPEDADDSVFCFHCHVADDAAQARQNAEGPFDLYVRTRLYAKSQTYDDILKSDLGLFGSVEQVTEKLVQLHKWGINHVMLLQNFGLMAPELVERSMRKIAEEVMPEVNRQIGAAA